MMQEMRQATENVNCRGKRNTVPSCAVEVTRTTMVVITSRDTDTSHVYMCSLISLMFVSPCCRSRSIIAGMSSERIPKSLRISVTACRPSL